MTDDCIFMKISGFIIRKEEIIRFPARNKFSCFPKHSGRPLGPVSQFGGVLELLRAYSGQEVNLTIHF
jgi:hypothetical protein